MSLFGEAMESILANIFGEKSFDGPVSMALISARIIYIDLFAVLNKDDMNGLTYIKEGDKKSLPLIKKKLLIITLEYWWTYPTLTKEQWKNINKKDILDFFIKLKLRDWQVISKQLKMPMNAQQKV